MYVPCSDDILIKFYTYSNNLQVL